MTTSKPILARIAANEKRALMEIDHERQITVKIERELQQLRENVLKNEERQRNELAVSKSELAEARQKLGVAEGKQDELRGVNKLQLEELTSLRKSQAKHDTQLALLQREIELTNAAAKQFQESIALKPAVPKQPRRNRKIQV